MGGTDALRAVRSGRQAIVLAVVQVFQYFIYCLSQGFLNAGCIFTGEQRRHFFFKLRAQQVHHASAPAQPRFPHQFLADVLALADGQPKLPFVNLCHQLADFEPFLIARLAPIQPLLVHEATPGDDVVRAVRVGFRRSFQFAPVGDAAAAASQRCRKLDNGFGYGDQ